MAKVKLTINGQGLLVVLGYDGRVEGQMLDPLQVLDWGLLETLGLGPILIILAVATVKVA